MMSGWLAVYIYAMVSGAITVNGTMPVALGWGVIRRDYYIATVIHYVLVAALFSIVYVVMFGVEKWFVSSSGVNFQYFVNALLAGKAVSFLLWFNFILILAMIAHAHVVGSVYYRFGKLGVFALLALGLLLIVAIHLFQLSTLLVRLLSKIGSIEQFTVVLVPWVIVLFAVGWFVLQKAPANKRG